MEWALDYLSNKHTKATPSNFLTLALYALEGRWHAALETCGVDQWFLLITSTYGHKDGDQPVFQTAIQCDNAEDGIAFTVKAYYDKFGDKRENWFNR